MKKTVSTLIAIFFLAANGLLAQKTKTYEVSNFNEISISVYSTVELKQGSTSLKIEGDEELIEKLEVKVSGSELIIKRKNGWGNYNSNDRLKIYVQTPKVNEINMSGSVKLNAPNSIETDKLDIDISGSGQCDFNNLTAKEVDLDISGSGNMTVSGAQKVDRFSLSVSGSGKLHAANLPVDHFNASISGSGRAEIHCTGLLEASIAGSGKIMYKGQPRFDTSVSGSGKIKPISN